MNMGNVNWAVQLYLDVQRKERSAEKAEEKLHNFLSSLSTEEFNSYAEKTVQIDLLRREAAEGK